MSQLHLMRALKFDTDDLRANRDGRISPAQRERYEPPKPSTIVVLAVLGHLALVGGLLVALAILTDSLILWLVLGVVVLLTFMPFGYMQELNRQPPIVRTDLARGKVEMRCGTVILREKAGRTPSFELLIEGIAVTLSPSEAGAFRNEGAYCVYYLPQSKRLLSAEPMA